MPIGEVADVAIPQLTGILGSPDRDEVLAPGSPCPPDAPWFRCVCDPASDPSGAWGCLDVATQLRSMYWGQLGLTLIFRDHIVIVDGQEVQGPVQLAYWLIEQPREGEPLTVEGVGPGILVSDLRQLPYAVIWYRGVPTLPSVVEVSLWGEGTYFVGVEWNGANPRDGGWYLAEVQRALNAHGAELDISGVADEPTLRAWDEFCREHDLECWFDEDTTLGGLMLAELELPPPDAAIVYMMSGGTYSIRY